MFEVARGFAHFFAHESCGFCTPCRVGHRLAGQAHGQAAGGHGSGDDLDVLFELDRLLHSTTIAAWGPAPATHLRDTVLKFRRPTSGACSRSILSPVLTWMLSCPLPGA